MKTGSPAKSPAGGQEAPVLRRFPRYPFQLPFRCRVHRVQANIPPRVNVGWTRQLSEGGAGVELGEALSSGSSLTLHVQTPRGAQEVQAQVVWTEKSLEAGGGIPHGLVYTAADAKFLHALRDLFQVLNVFQALGATPRAGIRLSIATPAICQAKYPPGPRVQGKTGNISREGLLLLLSEVMTPGTVLAVTLEGPHGPISLEGVIVWRDTSAQAALEEFVRHGVQLTTRDWATALALGDLVAALGKEPTPPCEPGGLTRTGALE